MTKVRILMVCLGNICRSPLAEGILASLNTTIDLFVDSAGTSAFHVGELPDNRSIEIANLNGIDLTHQRSRKFQINDFDKFDIIYAMDKSNYANLLELARDNTDKQKIKLILNTLYPNKNKSVPDPYYGGNDGFKDVFDMLYKSCEEIILKLKNNER